MKKLKLFGAVVLAASMLFAGCSTAAEEEPEQETIKPAPTPNPDPDPDPNPDPEPNYDAPDLSGYYKKSLLGAAGIHTESWENVSTNTPNDDGSISIIPGTKWGSSTSCLAIQGFEKGALANYEYIVFTLDITDFSFKYDEADADNRNDGVNIKIPEVMKDISSECVVNGKLRTYYAQLSSFGTAPTTADQFALIIGGTGTLKVNEVYLAATEDPANKAVTGITISPASTSISKGGKQQFTVTDSNYVNRTNEVTYVLSGDAAEGSSITDAGLLTVGTTAGTITVTATYTVGGNEFNAESSITVLGAMTNLITETTSTGWNTDANPNPKITGNLAEGWSVDFIASTFQWGAQLKIQTDADIAVGDAYYFSVDLESTVDMNNVTVKFDNDVQIVYDTKTTLVANTKKTVTFSGTIEEGKSKDDIMVVFDFGNNPEATVQVKNLILAKTN